MGQLDPTQNYIKKNSLTAPTKLLNEPKPKTKAHVLPTSYYLSLHHATLYIFDIQRCTRLVSAVISLSNNVWRPLFDLEFETLSLGLNFSNLLLFVSFSVTHFHIFTLSVSRSQPLIISQSITIRLQSRLSSLRRRDVVVLNLLSSPSFSLDLDLSSFSKSLTELVSIFF